MNIRHYARMIFIAGFLVLIMMPSTFYSQEKNAMPPYKNSSLSPEERANDLVSRLTLEEKLSLLGGTGFETKAIPRLGIPPLNMTDGPVGVRWKASSSFPVSIVMAATWNPDLIQQVGGALARETKGKGRRMLLGPCVNIHRAPMAGRNFESFGEDPYLASRMAVAYVKGVQNEHVIATTKHFACNNQEYQRDFINVHVDERALREIYLPAFEAAVRESGSWSVMSAYNKVNGAWCSENPHLLSDILKKEWGFKGFVVSDWGAVHSTVPTANAGLDVEMPEGDYLNPSTLLPAIKNGEVTEATINDKITRLLRAMFWTGVFDAPDKTDDTLVNTQAHRSIALNIAREGIVLLKNAGSVLPLHRESVKSIAVIGPSAAVARTGGGGSSKVTPVYAVTPLDGLKAKAGTAITVRFAQGAFMAGDVDPLESSALRPPASMDATEGLQGEYFTNPDLSGTPALVRLDKQVDFEWGDGAPADVIPADKFSVRWTGKLIAPKSGTFQLNVMSDDGVRLYLDGKQLIDDWRDHGIETASAMVTLEAGKAYDLRLEYYENKGGAMVRLGWNKQTDTGIAEAVELARTSDAAIVFAGLSANIESEGFDRKTCALPENQVQLIEAVSKVNPKTIVVINSGAPVLMDSWLSRVPAVVEEWYPGEEGGNAIAEILFGDVNPSGKLPMTFFHRYEDSPASATYPGKDSAIAYSEGIFVGYRHFDKENIEPLFPFGHGLSYSTFEYSNLRVSTSDAAAPRSIRVTVDVKNTSTREGSEVVQLYVGESHPAVPRPPKELKGFQKVSLRPGESKTVTFTLDDRSFSYYDADKKSWVVNPGTFECKVGSSSRLIRLSTLLDVH